MDQSILYFRFSHNLFDLASEVDEIDFSSCGKIMTVIKDLHSFPLFYNETDTFVIVKRIVHRVLKPAEEDKVEYLFNHGETVDTRYTA